MSKFHLFWTITLMLIFIGITLWAWSSARKKDFEQASRLPLDDSDSVADSIKVRGEHNV